MKPVKFPQHNVVYAENQKEYRPLPAYHDETESISCWKLTRKERWQIFLGRPLWLRQMNYGSPLQPQLPTLDSPFKKTEWMYSFNIDHHLNVGNLNRYDIIRDQDREVIVVKKIWNQSGNSYTFICTPENELTKWQKFWFKNKKKKQIYNAS